MPGLKSLNQTGTVHQDLKPENILVRDGKDRPVALLGDVGVAKQFSNQNSLKKFKNLTTQAGTEEWMAPEMRNPDLIQLGRDKDVKKIDYRKLDVFSLGLISLFCLDSVDNFYKYNRHLNENSNTLHEVYLPQLKSKMPIEFYCLLKSMLSFDWNARPSIEELSDFATVFLVKSQ